MKTNLEKAAAILEWLWLQGTKEICLCAGSRNSPFVEVLSQDNKFKVFHFFEERSAGFFALQRSIQRKYKVAVICTSGTAVAELLPSCIEAYYSYASVAFISADRPKSYRGSGAPQSMEQYHIFDKHILHKEDLDIGQEFAPTWTWLERTIYLNICFDEPLVEGKIPALKLPDTKAVKQSPITNPIRPAPINRPLIILGHLQNPKEVLEVIKKWQVPILAEASSGLREEKELDKFMIKSGENFARKHFHQFQSVIRIGDIPSFRIWRDLEKKNIKTYHFSEKKWTGLSRRDAIYDIVAIQNLQIENVEFAPTFWTEDRDKYLKTLDLLSHYAKSEASMVYQLSLAMRKDGRVYLGNSLPIRHWNQFASIEKTFSAYGHNRGMNGIDGQISSFLGFSKSETDNWAILGDLTTMYDMAGPWIMDQLPREQMHQIVVLNNSGGQIFSRIHKKDIYINRHKKTFEGMAKMWSMEYEAVTNVPSQMRALHNKIWEIIPDAEESKNFDMKLDLLWK